MRETDYKTESLKPMTVSGAMDWEMDWLGKWRTRRIAAMESVRATEADLNAGRLLLAAETANVWFAIRRHHEDQVIIGDSIKHQDAILAIYRDRFQAGLIDAAVIERQEAERRLAEAVEHQQLLTREASHRVKNSLALVSAMLNLQKQEDDDPRVLRMLNDAQARITAIAQTHDQLWRGDRVGIVSLDDLACGIAVQLAQQSQNHQVHCDIEAIEISADTAIPIGLMLTELLTNAIKYAYGESGGDIDVGLHARDGHIILSVRDHGQGLPADFDMKAASRHSLGMRMIASLARQLRGEIMFETMAPGTCATLTMVDPRD